MKPFLTILIFLFACCSVLQAQTMSQSFGNVFNSVPGATDHETILLTGGNYFQKTNLVNSNDIALSSYSENGASPYDTYFSKDWSEGYVTTIDNKTYSENLVFMFDKAGRQLYFKHNNSDTVMEANMNEVSVFSLVTDKPHIFINENLLTKQHDG